MFKPKIETKEKLELKLKGITNDEPLDLLNLHEKDMVKISNKESGNKENGNKDLRDILNMEVSEAYEERKRTAKILAEEASTKLILPLMLMLSIIMIVMIVPALSNM